MQVDKPAQCKLLASRLLSSLHGNAIMSHSVTCLQAAPWTNSQWLNSGAPPRACSIFILYNTIYWTQTDVYIAMNLAHNLPRFEIFRRKTEIFLSLSGDSQEMPIESLGLYFFNWQVEVWTFSGELAGDNNLRWTGQEQRSQTPNLNLELITIKYSNQIVFCRLDFKFVTFILALTPIMEYAKLDLRLMDITEALAANNTTVNSSWWTGW